MSQSGESVTENIISLNKFRPRQKVNPLRLVEGYWEALREGTDIPKRSDINPRGLVDVLEHVFILERVAPGVARFRIAGSQWNHLAGMEVRGVPISSFFRSTRRNDMAAALEACFDTPASVEATLLARSLQQAPEVPGRMLLLPMRCDLGRISRILGAIKMSGPLVSDAYRLQLDDVQVTPLLDVQEDVPPTRPQLAEAPAPFTGRPNLQLVHSADPVS